MVKSGETAQAGGREGQGRGHSSRARHCGEGRFCRLFEAAADAVTVYDRAGRVLDANREACASLGYSREELLSLSISDYSVRFGSPEVAEQISSALKTGAATLEDLHRRKNGTTFPVEMRLSRLEGEGGSQIVAVCRDVTDRKRSEEHFRGLVASLPDGISVASPDGRLLYYSDQLLALYRVPQDQDMRGQPILRWVHPDFHALALERIGGILRGGESLGPAEYRMLRADGTAFWGELTSAVLRQADGSLEGLLTVTRDVTERRRAAEQVKESEERYRQLVEMAPVAILLHREGRIAFGNPRAARLLGASEAEDLRGTSILDIVHPDSRPTVSERLQKMAAEPGPLPTVELRLLARDGRVVDVEATSSALVCDGARSVQTVLQDITARKRADRELQESEERFRAIFEVSPLGIAISRGGRQLQANTAFARLFGYENPEEVGGTALVDQLAPSVREGLEARNLCRDQGVPESSVCETLGLRRDGTEFPLLVEAAGIQLADGPATLVFFVDLTQREKEEKERKALEDKIQHAQKLESLGVLAGGIAHDFNNLLTGVLGYADLALLELSPVSPARDSIERIAACATRAAELTKQMLAYSGKGRFVVQPVSLSEIVQEMTHLLQVSLSKHCVVRYHFAPDLPLVEADATQIRQIVMNLVLNASEAIGERSGVVAVSTGAAWCDRGYLAQGFLDENLPEGLYAFLEVADTGAGMSQEVRAKIFDPFFTTKFTGRGLGLAAVLGIVRGHRGTIRVHSEPGKGTTFKILLPVTRSPSAGGGASEPVRGVWRGSGTVLVVDDEETVRALAQGMLEALGFGVLCARDGLEAVEVYRARADEIRLVLLDMTMPRLDGEQTFRELRRVREDVRVVLSSGYNEQDATQRFSGKGLAGFLQKPYRVRELSEVVKSALGG